MVKRDKKGLWQKGCSGNPSGTNGHVKGLQRYGSRAAYWLQTLTFGELEELCSDSERLRKLSSWDAIILRHISNAISGNCTSVERETLLSRIEGKPSSASELEAEEAKNIHYRISWLPSS